MQHVVLRSLDILQFPWLFNNNGLLKFLVQFVQLLAACNCFLSFWQRVINYSPVTSPRVHRYLFCPILNLVIFTRSTIVSIFSFRYVTLIFHTRSRSDLKMAVSFSLERGNALSFIDHAFLS